MQAPRRSVQLLAHAGLIATTLFVLFPYAWMLVTSIKPIADVVAWPVRWLPRVVTLSLLIPLFFVYGSAFALLGGLLVATPILGLSPIAYLTQTQDAIGGANFAIGALKALLFGAVVALIGCHQGLRASRSAAGVGAATTSAVVNSIIAVIALDAVFAVCAHALRI